MSLLHTAVGLADESPCPLLGCAHLPQVPALTHSLLGTTGTPCSRLYRWPALAAAGPTEMSALETNAPAPQTASASECPRPRQRWGHCLQGNRDGAPRQCRPSSSKPWLKGLASETKPPKGHKSLLFPCGFYICNCENMQTKPEPQRPMLE